MISARRFSAHSKRRKNPRLVGRRQRERGLLIICGELATLPTQVISLRLLLLPAECDQRQSNAGCGVENASLVNMFYWRDDVIGKDMRHPHKQPARGSGEA